MVTTHRDMEEKTLHMLQTQLIELLRSELNETEPDKSVMESLTPEGITALYHMAKQHDLAHVVSAALHRSGINTTMDRAVAAGYAKEEMLSLYRLEQMKYACDRITTAFDQASVPYIPLKGSVIRPYYPTERMRTSCDIDILVKKDDLPRAVSVLEAEGYRVEEESHHDVSLFSPEGIHLELHFSLLENMEAPDRVLKKAWTYAAPLGESSTHYAFTGGFFLFYMVAHMAFHFLSGGCGLRSLMDLWVVEHKMNVPLADAEAHLKEAGLWSFAVEMTRLSDVCFSEAEGDGFTQTLLFYIVTGGVYGNMENDIAINDAQSRLTFRYMVKRVFVPYRDVALQYPVLKKAPILFPFCWIHRTARLFVRFVKRVFVKRRAAARVPDHKIDRMTQMRNRLGL